MFVYAKEGLTAFCFMQGKVWLQVDLLVKCNEEVLGSVSGYCYFVSWFVNFSMDDSSARCLWWQHSIQWSRSNPI